jgi:transposase
MLLKVWILGHIYHVYTSRQLAKMLPEYTAFMWISGKQEPDFGTLNNFRKRLGKDIKSIIKEIAKLAIKMGIVKA